MNAPASRPVKVLVVDDSIIVRKMVTDALRGDPQLEVVGTANDPYDARDKILELKPDVVTLDIEMPRMDGITFLKILMKHHPLPVIVMSSLSKAGSQMALDALEAGAVDVLAKPGSSIFLSDLAPDLIHKIKMAARAPKGGRALATAAAGGVAGGTAPGVPATGAPGIPHPGQLILLGASTGGTEALKDVFSLLPAGLPPIVVVQHIPGSFSGPFAERLNSVSAVRVREARDGDMLQPGMALVAPGDYHMVVKRSATGGYAVQVRTGPKIQHHRPSIDLCMQSAAPLAGKRAVAGIFTGMGRDGAEGLLALRQAGAQTFAQDEKTCVVFGMPRVAMEIGAAAKMLPLGSIASYIVRAASMAAAKSSAGG
jgi:two-component system, chemotaxis family, protein-glutamate methylesterase/glutaminase